MSVNFGFGPRFPITCIMLFNYLNINQLWGHNRFRPGDVIWILNWLPATAPSIRMLTGSLVCIAAVGSAGDTSVAVNADTAGIAARQRIAASTRMKITWIRLSLSLIDTSTPH